MDRSDRIDVVASQAHGLLARTGLTADQANRAVWFAPTSDHAFEPVGGPRAVALFFAVSRQTKIPLLPVRTRWSTWLLDRAYEWIARHRHRFPGMTPWCTSHPDACSPAGDDIDGTERPGMTHESGDEPTNGALR